MFKILWAKFTLWNNFICFKCGSALAFLSGPGGGWYVCRRCRDDEDKKNKTQVQLAKEILGFERKQP
jgi:hypothetical protein